MEVPGASLIDRGEPESVEESKESKDQETTVSMVKPRVGDVIDSVAWTGGSNLDGEKLTEPEDTLCFCPTSFKEKQKQHESLKSGLPEAHKLELLGGNKTSIGLTMWVTWMMMMLVQKGMDTVFCILHDNDKKEINMLKNWGECAKEKSQGMGQKGEDCIG